MFHPSKLLIDTYVEHLQKNYRRTFGVQEPDFPGVLGFIGRIVLENVAKTDAPYHEIQHTILVTEVGQQILTGMHIIQGGVRPQDWVHFVIACLCHDIGYVRGVCQGDGDGLYVINANRERVSVPLGATDASMTPYHVERSQLFVLDRFGKVGYLNAQEIADMIAMTKFPKVSLPPSRITLLGRLTRGADLIGQMADIHYLRKTAALFHEFQEIGVDKVLGYSSPADLRTGYPKFFWAMVRPDIGEALAFLEVTTEGKMWVNNLYANVFIQEHHDKIDNHIDRTPALIPM
ncbi:MAG: metal-dependent phosphohydrolase [Magnetococcales bacterium]|nr:metal-dependent phosphohydrolase [Magnetococcales bacterium]